MRNVTSDVAVVGLGPAGASAAREAARRGLTVIALDRKHRAGEPVQCAEFVPRFPFSPIDATREAACQAIDAMQTFVETQPADVQSEFPGVMIDRARFDAALVNQAIAQGADCQFATSVRDIDDDGRLLLSNETRIQARVVIAADGPRSKIGRAVGQVNHELVTARQLSAPMHDPHSATDIFLCAEYVGGYGWLFPRDGIANIGIGVVPTMSAKLNDFLDRLHRALVDEGRVGDTCLSRTGGMIPVGGISATSHLLADTRILFCGDAAGLTNPVTGAGIGAAVQSGHLAGEAAALFVNGDAGAVEDYDEEVRDVFGPSLSRAYARRNAIMETYSRHGRPTEKELRASWIAYPEYWAA